MLQGPRSAGVSEPHRFSRKEYVVERCASPISNFYMCWPLALEGQNKEPGNSETALNGLSGGTEVSFSWDMSGQKLAVQEARLSRGLQVAKSQVGGLSTLDHARATRGMRAVGLPSAPGSRGWPAGLWLGAPGPHHLRGNAPRVQSPGSSQTNQ